jgi:tetratricopeptide (TPR) repeat protein
MFGSLALLGLMQPVAARAQTSSASEADALFHRGKERLAAGDYAEACPLLAESYSLDPASGTLLALAVCHEREGKLATAFTEYGEVAVRSRAERRKDRAGAARDKAAELEGKLSHLTIDAAQLAQERAPEVRLDGELLGPERLGTPLVLDGGVKQIEVSAHGKQAWSTSVTLAESGDAITLAIPALAPLAVQSAAPAEPARADLPFLYAPPESARRAATAPPHEREGRRAPAEWTGIGLMASGALSLTIATGYMARAIHKDNAAEVDCEGAGCESAAQENQLASQRATDGAAVSALVGLGLSTGGLISFLIGRHHRPSARAAACTTASAWAAPGAFGAAVRGFY